MLPIGRWGVSRSIGIESICRRQPVVAVLAGVSLSGGSATLLLWGDQDALVPRAEQDALLAAIPDARLLVYSDAGHSPNWEQPERVARDIEAFLRRHAPKGSTSPLRHSTRSRTPKHEA